MEELLIILVGMLIIGYPMFYVGKLIFWNKIKQKENRKVSSKEIVYSLIIVFLLFGGIFIAQNHSKILGILMTLSAFIIGAVFDLISRRKK